MSAIRLVTATEAVVKTASVEIKTLTVSGKQVTLAVFRQLEEVRLVDPDTAELAGVPWGRVNYHPDPACKDAGEHIHVVWQQGDALYRSFVGKGRPHAEAGRDASAVRDAEDDRRLAGEALVLSALLAGEDGEYVAESPENALDTWVRVRVHGWTATVPRHDWSGPGATVLHWVKPHPDGYHQYATTPQTKYVYDRDGRQTTRKETPGEVEQRIAAWRTGQRPLLEKQLAALADRIGVPREDDPATWLETVQYFHREALAAQAVVDRRAAAWQQTYDTLRVLDHLFIAV